MNHVVAIEGGQITGPGAKSRIAKSHLRVRLTCALLVADVAAILAAAFLAGFVRFGASFVEPVSFAFAVTPLYFLSGMVLQAFWGVALTQRATSMRLASVAFAVGMGLLLMLLFVLQQNDDVSRVQVGLGGFLALFFLMFGRFAVVSYSRRALDGELLATVQIDDLGEKVLFYGSQNQPAVRLSWDIETDDPAGYHELAQLVGSTDRAVVRCHPHRRARWTHILNGMNVHAEIVATELDDGTILGIGRVGDELTLVVASGPLGLADRMVKRMFDILFASAAILVLLPLLLLTACAIKLDSKGPIFFRQPRIGRQNKLFRIYKFRSMRDDRGDTGGVISTARDDDRVTRVGRLIRRTSIDELPQLINVLTGDMSIVGPRPHAVHSTAQDKLFWEVDPAYWHRHACKPGITGLAQVRGHRGATARELDLKNRLAADLEYLSQWSLWLDASILIRTLGVIVHRNAF